MGNPNGGLTSDIDRVVQDLLNTTKHRVDNELGFELLPASNSSPDDHLEDILPC
jgi:hypothetical protein